MEFEDKFVSEQRNFAIVKNHSLNEDCCEVEGEIRDPSKLCFRSIESSLPPATTANHFSACIPARESLNKSRSHCMSSATSLIASAISPHLIQADALCANDVKKDEIHSSYCMKPSSEALLEMKRKKYNNEIGEIQKLQNDFLFVGNPAQVYEDVIISNYIPRYKLNILNVFCC